jgi:hypothetical protein
MTKMPELRFYSYEEIRRIAEEYSQRHGLDKDVPVDVDRLADNILGINIIPLPFAIQELRDQCFYFQ